MRLKDASLGTKLKIIIMVACVLVLSISSTLYIANDLFRLRQDIVEKLTTLGRVVGANCAAALVFEDREAADEMLGAFSAEPRILSALLKTEDGTVFAEYRNAGREADGAPHSAESLALREQPFVPVAPGHRLAQFYGDSIRLGLPILVRDRTVGSIHLSYGKDEYVNRMKRYIRIVLIVLALTILVAYFLASNLQRIISEPVASLAEHMRQVSKMKDYSLVKTRTSTDEIGSLVEGFNEMLGEIKVRDDELIATQARLQQLLVSTPAVIYSLRVGQPFDVTYVSENAGKLLGYKLGDLVEDPEFWADHVHTDDMSEVLTKMTLLADRERVSLEFRFRHGDGEYRWVYTEVQLLGRGGEGTREAIGYMIDISDRKKLENRLHQDAFYDRLTGLPNRALLVDRLGVCLEQHARDKTRMFALMFLDLDRFKNVNDSYGHPVGDRLLVEIGKKLGKFIRAGDTVARLGGDEFAFLLDDIRDVGETKHVADRILKDLELPVELAETSIYTSASIGITTSVSGYDAPDQMIRDADNAMYQAKIKGKGCSVMFDPSMHRESLGRLELEDDLRKGIKQELFELFYQPVVELETRRVVGFEALTRWRHPKRGILAPGQFIPLAEEIGLIHNLGRWVARSACEQLKVWQQRFPAEDPLHVSINISSLQLRDNLYDELRTAIEETGIASGSLMIEVTESALIDKEEAISKLLLRIKELGVRLCIDDFGTGYSSLSYLHRFPFDILKIDRSFVSTMDTNQEQLEVVRAIATLARSVRMETVIEGVESARQHELARELECGYAQGFYYDRPMEKEDVERLLMAQFSGSGHTGDTGEARLDV